MEPRVEANPVWWNLDLFLADTISSRLKEFVTNTVSFPAGSTKDEWEEKLISIATRLDNYKSRFEVSSLEKETKLTVDAKEAMHELADVFHMLWD